MKNPISVLRARLLAYLLRKNPATTTSSTSQTIYVNSGKATTTTAGADVSFTIRRTK